MSEHDEAAQRYWKTMETLLNEPGFVERIAKQSPIDINGMVEDLCDAFDLPHTILGPIHLGRYEEMNDADKQMLRDMGIEP